MEGKYIGRGQAAVMLMLFGVIYCVLGSLHASAGELMTSAAASAVVMAVLFVPLSVLMSGSRGSVPMQCVTRLGVAGRVISLLYFAYFIAAAADILRKYSIFTSERYFREAGPALCVILLGAVCVYISHTGAETVCRMSTVLLVMLIIVSVIFAAGSWSSIKSFDYGSIMPSRLSLSAGFGVMFPLGAAGCICMCVLCGGLEGRTRPGAYLGTAAMLIAVVVTVAGVSVTIGDYAYSSEYPLTDAVIYSAKDSAFRNDGIFFALWTVAAAAVISLLAACGGRSFKCAFSDVKGEGLISGGSAAALALAGTYSGRSLTAPVYESPYSAVILLAAVPLLLIIAGRLTPKKEEVNEAVVAHSRVAYGSGGVGGLQRGAGQRKNVRSAHGHRGG